MPLVIQDHNSPPVERWQYPAVAGPNLDAGNWNQLYETVAKHYEGNGASIPSQQMVIDWVCKNLRVRCYDSETRVPLVNLFTQNIPYNPPACCGRSNK